MQNDLVEIARQAYGRMGHARAYSADSWREAIDAETIGGSQLLSDNDLKVVEDEIRRLIDRHRGY